MNTPPIDQITLRDFFAAAALTGLLANGDRKSAVGKRLCHGRQDAFGA